MAVLRKGTTSEFQRAETSLGPTPALTTAEPPSCAAARSPYASAAADAAGAGPVDAVGAAAAGAAAGAANGGGKWPPKGLHPPMQPSMQPSMQPPMPARRLPRTCGHSLTVRPELSEHIPPLAPSAPAALLGARPWARPQGLSQWTPDAAGALMRCFDALRVPLVDDDEPLVDAEPTGGAEALVAALVEAGVAVPRTESIRDAVARVEPLWREELRPALLTQGRHVLVVGHANCLRALIRCVQGLDDVQLAKLGVPNALVGLPARAGCRTSRRCAARRCAARAASLRVR